MTKINEARTALNNGIGLSTAARVLSGFVLLGASTLAFAPNAQATEQFTVSSGSTPPACEPGQANYAATGSFVMVVIDGNDCAGTYTVNAAPVAGSAADGSTPPQTTITTYIGFGQGTFAFNNAGDGSYTVTVTSTNGCTPPVNPVVTVVTLTSQDSTPPTVRLRNSFGVVFVDSDPATMGIPASIDLGTEVQPAGSCNRREVYTAELVDSCDGTLTDAGRMMGVVVTSEASPGSASPGSQTMVAADGHPYGCRR